MSERSNLGNIGLEMYPWQFGDFGNCNGRVAGYRDELSRRVVRTTLCVEHTFPEPIAVFLIFFVRA
jgi:hypothetical protein